MENLKTNELGTISNLFANLQNRISDYLNIQNPLILQINQIQDTRDNTILISGYISNSSELDALESHNNDESADITDNVTDYIEDFVQDLVNALIPETDPVFKDQKRETIKSTGLEIFQYPKSGVRLSIMRSDFGLYFTYAVTLG